MTHTLLHLEGINKREKSTLFVLYQWCLHIWLLKFGHFNHDFMELYFTNNDTKFLDQNVYYLFLAQD